jgi:hypothetical protein
MEVAKSVLKKDIDSLPKSIEVRLAVYGKN